MRRENDAAIAREAADKAPPAIVNGVAQMSFRWLAFQPEASPAADASEPSYGALVPARIKQFDHVPIHIKGYMLPTRVEGTRVREFMILPSPSTCCFGSAPKFCEFINARVLGAPVKAVTNEPIGFEGTFHVGDVYVNGYWAALYTMDCTGIAR